MNRYNDSGEMIDVSKLNRSVIAQESVIEAINDMIEAENSDIDPLQAFALGLYASQFQMKYMIMQAISRGEEPSEYDNQLVNILNVTEQNTFGNIFTFEEVDKMIDVWIDKHFPHTMESFPQ
jgi:hypothetical protein